MLEINEVMVRLFSQYSVIGNSCHPTKTVGQVTGGTPERTGYRAHYALTKNVTP